MIEILGWFCTAAVIIAFWLNAEGYSKQALIIWAIGDFGWIIYDYFISNWSHATLSSIILIINIYGYTRLKKNVMSKRKIDKVSIDLFS